MKQIIHSITNTNLLRRLGVALLLAFAFNVKGWRAVLGSPVVTA